MGFRCTECLHVDDIISAVSSLSKLSLHSQLHYLIPFMELRHGQRETEKPYVCPVLLKGIYASASS